jgi:hypothetical protein
MKQFRYEQTAAGANAIRKALGVSDFRSKRLRNDLVAMRWGEHGERFLIEPTGKSAGNKPLYRIGRWGGDVAYVPDLLTDGSPGALARLFGASAPPEVRRDALLMLLYAYAHVNYMDYFGVPPDAFVHAEWDCNGECDVADYPLELGYAGEYAGLHFWLFHEARDGARYSTKQAASMIFGSEDTGRLWAAHDLLMGTGLLCRVILVTGTEPWPLWIGSASYRKGLAAIGVVGDLARLAFNAAQRGGLDPDAALASAATGTQGDTAYPTEVYFVPASDNTQPELLTLYAPTFHAPTPVNIEELAEMAARTKRWASLLESARQRKTA